MRLENRPPTAPPGRRSRVVIIDFFQRYGPDSFWRLASIAAISGVVNTLILAAVNAAADLEAASSRRDLLLLEFAVAVLLFSVSQFELMAEGSNIMESAIEKARAELFQNLASASLPKIEGIGRAAIFAAFSKHTQALSQSAPFLCVAGQAALMVLFSVAYLASISLAAFAVTAVLLTAATIVFLRTLRSYWNRLDSANAKETEMLSLLQETQQGFKEVKLNQRRANAIHDSLRDTSRNLESLKTLAQQKFAVSWIFSQMMFYILMGTLVFLMPRFAAGFSTDLQKITSTILFISAPTLLFAEVARVLSTAEASIDSLLDLNRSLREGRDVAASGATGAGQFQSLRLDGMEYWYSSDQRRGFRVGPINLELAPGEIVFLVGGNGSGKTTVLKLLTGLYPPKAGRIWLDGTVMKPSDYGAYRSLFSAVFTEYHVFDRLYGIPETSEDVVAALLRRFDLQHKTSFSNRKWTTRDLSTGQRKRLALIVAHLEDRPVWVLDEWAADQDPEFRRKFYVELLPELKKSGKTIIAASHDDRYFGAADRIIKIEGGVFVEAANTAGTHGSQVEKD